MSTKNIEKMKQQIEELQAQIETEQARAARLSEDELASIRFHDISCRDSYCSWSFEGGDAAFAKPGSEHNQIKGEYLDLKADAENQVGVPISHDNFIDLLLILSGIYYEKEQ